MTDARSTLETPPETLRLRGHAVTLAVVDATDTLMRFNPTSDEQARLNRMRTDAQKAEFRLARGLARALVHYERSLRGLPPTPVDLNTDADGAPLRDGNTGLYLSWSSKPDLALAATCATARIGCDLEVIRPLDWPGMLRRIASTEETRAVLDQRAADIPAAFFRLWVLKESVLKARRTGFRQGARDTAIPPVLIRGDAATGETEIDGNHYALHWRQNGDRMIGLAVTLSPETAP